VGIPIWGVSIGLLHEGAPVAGVFYMPELDDLFAAERGSGAFLNGSRVRPDARGVVDQNSLVAFNSDAFQELDFRTPAMLRNLGSAAAHGCYVASGSLTAAVFHLWRTWDLAAALCIAFEAGAVARYLDGTPLTSLADMPPLAAGEPMILGPECAVETLLSGVTSRPA
jgi:myo-inositol-1(or 4)-monophosphatase